MSADVKFRDLIGAVKPTLLTAHSREVNGLSIGEELGAVADRVWGRHRRVI